MSEMDDFLARKPEAEPAPEAEPQAEAPSPAPEQEAPPAPEAAPEAEEEAEPVAKEGEPLVPRRAYEDERRKRQDHKAEAARLAGELAEVRRQMEEIKKAPPQPPQQYQPPPIDLAQDPQGFVSRVQEVVLNERLNTSEMMARQAHGAEAVDAAIEEFKAAAQADPGLFQKLYATPHPYDWMLKQVEKLRVQREMGDDPAAYRAKIEADIRTKVLAEMGAAQPQQPRVSPAAGLAPSLASVRSAAPRSAPAFSGPPSMEDVIGRR